MPGDTSGDGQLTIDSGRFAEMIELFEDAFLVILPKERREELRREAKRTAADAWDIPNLGHFAPLAFAELHLKFLRVRVLEELSGQFAAEMRLPEWDQALTETKMELETSRRRWRDVSSALARRKS